MSDYQRITKATEELLNEKSVDVEYGLRGPWLKKRRKLGLSPKYYRIGRMIRYKRGDIEAFIEGRAVEPTVGGD